MRSPTAGVAPYRAAQQPGGDTQPGLGPDGRADDGVLAHLKWLRLRNVRETTVYNRTCALGRLRRWADRAHGGPVLLLELGYDELIAWQEERSGQLTPSARRGELSHAREFYRWAAREGLRADDPTIRIPMPRAPRRLPRPMSEADFERALDKADPRTAAVLALAGYAGLRSMEIGMLDWSEIDLSGDPPKVRIVDGKGGLGRVVPIGTTLAEVLKRLPSHRGPVIPRGDGNRGYNPAWGISHLGNRYLHDIGIPETLHQLRHRFATAAYRADNDLRAVQDLLGHASPTTTSMYAAPSRGSTVRAVASASVVESEDGVILREILVEGPALVTRLRRRMAADASISERLIELEIRQVSGPPAICRIPADPQWLDQLIAALAATRQRLAPVAVA